MFMDAADRSTPTRIAISRQMIPLWVVVMLTVLLELALFFIIGAVVRPRESLRWIAITIVVIAITYLTYRKYAHSRRDWDRTVYVELRDGKIVLVPDRRMRWNGYAAAEAHFPIGASLEYRIETGDRYFTGDHGQVLRYSLWVIEPTGIRQQLLNSAAYLNLRTAAANLETARVPFRIIKVYDGQEGEHTEADVTAEGIQASTKAWSVGLVAVVTATSSLWLGAIVGAMVHNWGYVIAIGLVGYAAIAVATILLSKNSPRAALIQVATLIPTYAAGYAVVTLVVRHLFNR